MSEKIVRKLKTVTLIQGVCVLVALISFCVFVASSCTAIEKRAYLIVALVAALLFFLTIILYFQLVPSYEKFLMRMFDWVREVEGKGLSCSRRVVELQYKQFSTFYNLNPDNWEISEEMCTYSPNAADDFAIIFSWVEYLKFKHNEVNSSKSKELRNQKKQAAEQEIQAIEKFAPELKEFQTVKNAIYFPYEKELPETLIENIARWCLC